MTKLNDEYAKKIREAEKKLDLDPQQRTVMETVMSVVGTIDRYKEVTKGRHA